MTLHLASHAPANAPSGTFLFDEAKAQRAVDFFQKILVHTKGRHARQPFMLADWQKHDLIVPLFGTMSYDSQYDEYVRQCRVAWIELGRKHRTANPN